MQRKLLPVISLFSGAGGMDLGFRRQGFLPILAIDIDEAAVASYNHNDKRVIARTGDLSEINDAGIIEIIRQTSPSISPRGVIGGPPCQSFSVGNVHRNAEDPRRILPLRYAQILKVLNREFNLDFFVFENVTGLKFDEHEQDYSNILKAFEDAGFKVFEQALNARMFGVPQNRRRVFIVGINKQLYPNVQFEFPKGNSEKMVTVRNAIGGLPSPAYFKRNIKRREIPYHPNH